MAFKLMNLPYEKHELEPHISVETVEHHLAHHLSYIDYLNQAITGTKYENYTIEKIVIEGEDVIYQYASKVLNHNFYWSCLIPANRKTFMSKQLMQTIVSQFDSIEKFKEQFNKLAMKHFGSGLVWLVKNNSGTLIILTTNNAETPVRYGLTPLLVCDLWEHAYYLDYQNSRQRYLDAFWNLVNWGYASGQYLNPLIDGKYTYIGHQSNCRLTNSY